MKSITQVPGFSRSSRENLSNWFEEFEEMDPVKKNNFSVKNNLKFKSSVHNLIYNDNLTRIQKCLDLEKQKILYCNELISNVKNHVYEINQRIDQKIK